MGTILNLPECSNSTGNTGYGDCWLDLKHIKGAILTPSDYEISAADLANLALLKAKLQLDTLADAKDRIYPIVNFIAIDDQSEDDVVETSGYGHESTVRSGQYKWTMRFSDGGMCLNKNLHTLAKGRKFGVLLYDADNQLVGKTDSTGKMYPFTLGNFDPKKLKVADGSAPTMYNVGLTLPNPEELNEQFGVVKFDVAIEKIIKGLLNVQLTTSNADGSGVDVEALIGCAQINMFDTFADELADTDAWIVKTSAGVVVSVSAVTKNTTDKTWTLAATLAAGTYTVQLAAPLTLYALGVGVPPENGYESNVKSFTVGS